MPGLVASDDSSRKRKRVVENGSKDGLKPRKAPKQKESSSDDAQARILLLEEQILESREHYNNIVELQKSVDNAEKKPKTAIIAAVALCRVFCRLIAGEKLANVKGSDADAKIAQWLQGRLQEYAKSLLSWIGSPDSTRESTALTLLMRLVKEEALGDGKHSAQVWTKESSTFVSVVRTLLKEENAEGARQEFAEKYIEEHDDVRYYTFAAVSQCLDQARNQQENMTGNAIDLLSQIEGVPESNDQLEDWFGSPPEGAKHKLLTLNAHRKVAREAWLAVFRSTLSHDQRKTILGLTTSHILPWFAGHIELIADFLTDSFNQGGSMALLALSGIFNLMTQKNLDYPEFYTKLYSLLDEDVLHSKHRSRFFRLLETFMSSTHLPAAMVASFIKRLSRLALQAPPGAIVWIVPWTYNMLKQHPQCTFMLHRAPHPAHTIYAKHPKYEEEGMDDVFDMAQKDPMLSAAIDSSLWELETLRSHYHPNLATLAKIVGEQFTKRDYQLEDFLDHSYATLIDAELGKEMKKTPVVEWEIPKRILTTESGEANDIGKLLQAAMNAD